MVDSKENYKCGLGVKGLITVLSSILLMKGHLKNNHSTNKTKNNLSVKFQPYLYLPNNLYNIFWPSFCKLSGKLWHFFILVFNGTCTWSGQPALSYHPVIPCGWPLNTRWIILICISLWVVCFPYFSTIQVENCGLNRMRQYKRKLLVCSLNRVNKRKWYNAQQLLFNSHTKMLN